MGFPSECTATGHLYSTLYSRSNIGCSDACHLKMPSKFHLMTQTIVTGHSITFYHTRLMIQCHKKLFLAFPTFKPPNYFKCLWKLPFPTIPYLFILGSSEAITNSSVGSIRPRKPNIKVTQSVCAPEVTYSGIIILEVLPLVPKYQECRIIRCQIKGILQY